MSIETLFNVQNASHGTALYLAYNADTGKTYWTTDAEAALPYEDEEEAHEDAAKHGGEVFSFQRWSPVRRLDYSEKARLERAFGFPSASQRTSAAKSISCAPSWSLWRAPLNGRSTENRKAKDMKGMKHDK